MGWKTIRPIHLNSDLSKEGEVLFYQYLSLYKTYVLNRCRTISVAKCAHTTFDSASV
jgi:hypothetical protein